MLTNKFKTAAGREAARRTGQLIRAYDAQSGPFAGFDYVSPWAAVDETWARRAGHPIGDLRTMITEFRVCRILSVALPDELAKVREDLVEATQRWRDETGYENRPTWFPQEKFPNRKALRGQLSNFSRVVPWNEQSVDVGSGNLIYSAVAPSDKAMSIYASLAVIYKYNGRIDPFFRFPDIEWPEIIHIGPETFRATSALGSLGLPMDDIPELVVGREPGDSASLAMALKLMKTIVEFLQTPPASN